jgi:acyl-CoA synthetase (AMP-forming)/AMP-acid ligase II/surfactin synthase thioesterase subunit/acyl carrier protein
MSEHENLCVRDLILEGNQNPDSPAIESPGYQPLTYRDLREQIAYVVRSLNARGFRPNDRIAIIMPNGPHAAVATIAVIAGFTAVPLNSQYKEPEYAGFFSSLGIKAVLVQKGAETTAIAVAGSHNIPVIEAGFSQAKAGLFTLFPEVDVRETDALYAAPKDTASLSLTSGTTAKPKIVPITQKRLFLGSQIMTSLLTMNETDKNLHFVPMDTSFGYGTPLWAPLFVGGNLICPRDFVASDFTRLLTTYRPTHYWGGPAHHQAVLQELKKVLPDELANHSLRFIGSGAAAISPAVRHELETMMGIPVIEAYVMSEAFISLNISGKKGSVGIPFIPYLEIRDDNDCALPVGQYGEIVVRGELVFGGYENAPVENAESFKDEWFRTGDMGYLDKNGYLFIAGRKKEMINKGGRKITPAEIDTVLMSHPCVRDAMTFRIPEPVLGEDIAAMVVKTDAQVSEEDLRQYCLNRLIQFKVPRRIFFIEEIPKNALGKPLREEGTKKFGDLATFSDQPEKMTGQEIFPRKTMTEERLLQLWKDVLDIPNVLPDNDFFLCGGNSLTAIHLLVKIQRTFQVNFPPDTIYRFPTLRQQAVIIAERNERPVRYHPLIVPIRDEGRQLPLFCVHPIGGWVDQYKNLARFLASDRPVYGIRAQGWEATENPFTSLEEAAREYVHAIKTVQATGPYQIIGFSGGALYVYELACQLRTNGDTIAFIGLIDQSAPVPEVLAFKTVTTIMSTSKRPLKIPFIVYRGYQHLKNRTKTHPDSKVHSVFVRFVRMFSQTVIHVAGSQSPATSARSVTYSPETEKFLTSTFPPEQQPLIREIIKNTMNYIPPDYSGDLVLFSTGLDQVIFPGDPTRGWGSHVKGTLKVITLAGDHNTLFIDENCRELASKIEENLLRSNGFQ